MTLDQANIAAFRDASTADRAKVWARMSYLERETVRDLSDLSPQLVGLEGCRVEVVDKYGETRRFKVGRSTGWRPCHLEVKTVRSLGGDPADKEYRSVRVIRRA